MKKDQAIATLIHYRLEQAEKAIEDAHCLLSGKGSPQSIINRSYYAMFYATLALMLRIGKSFSKHSGAISAFDKEFVHKGLLPKKLSADLHNVFELRQDHDYKIISNPSIDEATNTLSKAERFISAVKDYLMNQINDKRDVHDEKE
ncbi:MAG: HEPN domain-containing protein [Thermodesulfobacteriota bacterium]